MAVSGLQHKSESAIEYLQERIKTLLSVEELNNSFTKKISS